MENKASYKVKLEIFEGPLDLLLHLVKQSRLEIDQIPISSITDQYIQYMELMKALDLDIAGEFLVMAATLMQIKSRMLLPPSLNEDEEEIDPAQELIDRLKEYERFKQAASVLGDKEEERSKLIGRNTGQKEFVGSVDEELMEASLFDLLTAFTDFMAAKSASDLVHEILQDEFTVEQKVDMLRNMVQERGRVSVTELFRNARSRMEVVATFLGILELIKRREMGVRQSRTFDEIVVVRVEQE